MHKLLLTAARNRYLAVVRQRYHAVLAALYMVEVYDIASVAAEKSSVELFLYVIKPVIEFKRSFALRMNRDFSAKHLAVCNLIKRKGVIGIFVFLILP